METVLILRTCNANMTSHKGFLWPEEGPVQCDDWDPLPRECGGGLHGLLWGEGAGELLNWDDDAKWLVVEVAKDIIAKSDDKVRFPRGWVVFCGNQYDATKHIRLRSAGRVVVGGTVTVGNKGAAHVGYHGTAIAGYKGAAITGVRGIAIAGDWGVATAGHEGTATSGVNGISHAGDYGTAIAGNYGTATVGVQGVARVGYSGFACVGDRGVANGELQGTLQAGDDGILQMIFWTSQRRRTVIAYVGENGIKPNTPYRLNYQDEFEEVT